VAIGCSLYVVGQLADKLTQLQRFPAIETHEAES
jgi:hypothetical protein